MARKKDITEIEVDSANRRDRFKNLTPLGYEIADPTPVAPPIGYKKQPTLVEQMRNMIRSEMLAREVAAQGQETFEESEDFEVGDDLPDPQSEWENDFDPPAKDIAAAVGDHRRATAAQQAQPPTPPSDGPNAPAPPATPPGGDAKPS